MGFVVGPPVRFGMNSGRYPDLFSRGGRSEWEGMKNLYRKYHTSLFPSTARPKTQTTTIQCKRNKSISDSELASELSKMTTLFAQRDEAIVKSRQLIFTELCQFLDSKPDEVSKKWRKLDEDEKWVLVKGFVSEWGVNFHPLSAKSVKDLVEEHLHHQNPPPKSPLIPGFKRIMGFSEDK